MSMPGTPFSAGSAETGETVATFSQYERAQKAVSALIAADVPAREIAIVGEGLRSVERITGKLGYAAAARSGAINGLMLGVLFAFVFVLGAPTVAIQAFVGVLLVGIALGMMLNIIVYAFVRRRRDYASVMQVAADHYEVKVLPSSVHRARAALAGAAAAPAAPAAPAARPAPPAAPAAPPAAVAPPRYGERIGTPDAGAPATPEPTTAPASDDGSPEGDPRQS